MKYRTGNTGLASLAVLFMSMAAVAIVADDDGSRRVYTVLDKAYYLAAEDAAWIRPGLKLEIQNISIPADRKPLVTFRITDDGGQGLDRDGRITPGSVSTSWVLASIPQDSTQYRAYTTRVQTSPITGKSATQASTDSGGTYTPTGDGTYQYKFGTALPADYDQTTTHTLGVYSTRNLSEFGLTRYVANELKSWVPNGSPVTKIREVVATANCNQCHNPLGLHGGSRQKTDLCILCHTPQTTDPDTGNTVDLKVMVHKIHRGELLPSVAGGKPYIIIGNQQSVNDFSTVVFPQDIRNCTVCHKDTRQVNNWLLNPSRATCGSCHDDVNFESGENHPGGSQVSDRFCSSCHLPEFEAGGEYDGSIKGSHVPLHRSNQLSKPVLEVLSIANTGPGQSPTVKFRITDKTGARLNAGALTGTAGRLALTLGGPTSDYRWYLQEMASGATMDSSGTATYTFTGKIPADASGSYALEAEGWVKAVIRGTAVKSQDYRDAWPTVVKYFAVTAASVSPRREVVDLAKCNKCHDKLQMHGNNRNDVYACVMCHNPANTDAARRPASAKPDQTIHFKVLIHRIHSGEELEDDFTVYGFGGTPFNFNEVRFPGDRRDCMQCHRPGTYTLPLPASATPSTTPRLYWSPTQPAAAACLGCHDSLAAAAHAYVNTAAFGESCAVCHKESADFAVSKVHAR